jgi:hypothetical protein
LSDELDLAEWAELERELERLEAAEAPCRWVPHVPTSKQAEFLELKELEALYGGAAGGGKSDALLADLLGYVDHPTYAGIAFRRTYKDLALPEALMDRAAQWLMPTAAQWADRDKRWTFPSGATLSFGYLDSENDKYRYQSARFHRVAFDELTQFTEGQYTYLFSRIRRATDDGIPLAMRSATNPGGIGHDWVHERFIEPGDSDRPFIPALLDDNPHIDQDAYRESLAKLDGTTRAQLEKGLWVRESGTLIYPFTAGNVVSVHDKDVPVTYGEGGKCEHDLTTVLVVDVGASELKPTTGFAVLGWGEHESITWALRAFKLALLTPTQIAENMKMLMEQYTCVKAIVDEGALGRGYGEEFRQRHGIHTEAAQKRDKLGFRKLIRGALQEDAVKVIREHCQELLDEMGTVTWDIAGIDAQKGQSIHLTDCLLYGWRFCRPYLAKPKENKPAYKSPEWYKAEEKRMEDQDMRDFKDQNFGPWWRS